MQIFSGITTCGLAQIAGDDSRAAIHEPCPLRCAPHLVLHDQIRDHLRARAIQHHKQARQDDRAYYYMVCTLRKGCTCGKRAQPEKRRSCLIDLLPSITPMSVDLKLDARCKGTIQWHSQQRGREGSGQGTQDYHGVCSGDCMIVPPQVGLRG